MAVYRDLLGAPLNSKEAGPDDERDPYRRRIETYGLSLWPALLLQVYGSKSGETGSVYFVRSSSSICEVSHPSIVVPWETVEDDTVLWPVRQVVDEWYPMRDYEIQAYESDERYVLQFDFGLLQSVFPSRRAR